MHRWSLQFWDTYTKSIDLIEEPIHINESEVTQFLQKHKNTKLHKKPVRKHFVAELVELVEEVLDIDPDH